MTFVSDSQMPVDTPETMAALAVLAEDVGTWDTELSITPYPGADPQLTRGAAVSRLVGGRWLVTDQRTESGFEGHGVYGWNQDLGAYVSAWVDIMGGGIARGAVYGKSDKTGSSPAENPVHPVELLATVYHALGIDPHTMVNNHLGQPRELVQAEPVLKLFS